MKKRQTNKPQEKTWQQTEVRVRGHSPRERQDSEIHLELCGPHSLLDKAERGSGEDSKRVLVGATVPVETFDVKA